GVGQGRRRLDCVSLGRDRQGLLVWVPAGHGVLGIALGGEADGGPDEAGADDRNAHTAKARGSLVAEPARFRAKWPVTMGAWPFHAPGGPTSAGTSLRSA